MIELNTLNAQLARMMVHRKAAVDDRGSRKGQDFVSDSPQNHPNPGCQRLG